MPVIYHQSRIKAEARHELVRCCRERFDLHRVPADRQYWCLCGEQPDVPGAEIVQLAAAGFLTKSQFHGVDRRLRTIADNRTAHPEALWYRGDWLKVIRQEDFRPAVVYLDTVHFAGANPGWDIVSGTMDLCPPGTILFANLLLKDPRSRRDFGDDGLMAGLWRRMPPPDRDRWEDFGRHYTYNNGRSLMGTYIFRSRR